jgi:hypothetical protein
MSKVKMVALREFPRTQGDSGGVRRVQPGEVFDVNSSEVEHLKATGKAKEAPQKAIAAAEKAEAALAPSEPGKEG